MVSLPPEKKEQCKEIFNFFDQDMDGRISKNDFSDAIKTLGIFIPKNELEAILDKLSIYDYSHFEEICAKKLSEKINKDSIIKSFLFLDPQKTGNCSKEKLKQAFLTLGEPLKEEEVDSLLKDFSKGNSVDYKKLIGALVGK